MMVALHYLCKTQTDGFSRIRIESDLPDDPSWEKVPIPNQTFYYLGCGAQTFAFVSEDGQYVIKFYRYHRASHPLALLAPFIPRLQRTVAKRKVKVKKDFASYRLAFDQLKEETGLITIHLGRTENLNQSLTFYDKLGIRHEIDLDNSTFLLQRKAEPFYSTLEQWIDQGCENRAKQAVTELIALIRFQCQQGIFDKDPDLGTNFGFLDGHPIEFDVGRFRNEPESIGPNELRRATNSLQRWLSKKAPQLLAHLEREIDD